MMKLSRGCALARRGSMPQAVALGARMCFFTSFIHLTKE